MTYDNTATAVVNPRPFARLDVAPLPGSGEVEVVRPAPVDLVVLAESAVDQAIDLTRSAKALPGAPKVIALVGQTSRDDLMALLAAGADATALRSVSAEELVAIISQVLSGERVVVPALMQLIVNGVGHDGGEPDINLTDRSDQLTAREREVLSHLARGASNQQIAKAMYVTQATVKTHLAHIYAKLKVGGRHEALSRAVALGVLR